jgi:6,7-dimethyl-8-ribityllumazine synthase
MSKPNRNQPEAPRRIAFVQSCWHEEIVECCRAAFAEEIVRLGVPERDLEFFRVPGAPCTPSAWPPAGATPPLSAPGS